jgi:hypothetical protein
MTAASRRRQYQQLELDVERAEAALIDARKVFDRQGPEAREAWRVRVAERKLEQAKARLRDPVKVILTEAEKAEAEEARLARRAPPDLEKLILAHAVYDAAGKQIGGYERITPAAWAKFDADTAEWKRKIREGLFDAKIWW